MTCWTLILGSRLVLILLKKKTFYLLWCKTHLNRILELKMLIDGLLFRLGILTQSLPGVCLIFKAQKVIFFHSTYQSCKWYAFCAGPVGFALTHEVFISNHVSFLKAEQLNEMFRDIFGLTYTWVCFNLLMLLSWEDPVTLCAFIGF